MVVKPAVSKQVKGWSRWLGPARDVAIRLQPICTIRSSNDRDSGNCGSASLTVTLLVVKVVVGSDEEWRRLEAPDVRERSQAGVFANEPGGMINSCNACALLMTITLPQILRSTILSRALPQCTRALTIVRMQIQQFSRW